MTENSTITDFLIATYGFTRLRPSKDEIDFDQFTCMLRVHELHYLFWSERMKHFTLKLKHEHPKGQAGVKGQSIWGPSITLPKVIRSTEDAQKLIEGVVNFEYLAVITQ